MKKFYVVSLVKNGLIGGGISADSEAITYRSGKVTIPQEYRNIVMKYEDISEVTMDSLFILPTVTVKMRSGKVYQFAVFFGRKGLVDILMDNMR